MSTTFAYNSSNQNISHEDVCITAFGAFYSNKDIAKIIFYAVIMALILSVNSILIRALLKKKRTRIDVYFLILSVSDLFVGLLSVPAEIIIHIGLSVETLCLISPYFNTFMVFPYSFSSAMTMIISTDRCVLVTNPNFHSKFGQRFLTYFIPFAFVFSATISFLNGPFDDKNKNKLVKSAEENDFKNNWTIVPLVVIACELVITILVTASQIYLVCYVTNRLSKMKNNRQSEVDYNKRMSLTVAIMFACSIACNVPHTITYCLFIIRKHDLKTHLYTTSLLHWANMTIYSSCFLNALIILGRSTKLRKRCFT
ncbi:mas-related G-protein coupled receptor member A-like [Hydractinia symbiolongicarpus]|uniref:mas-related G-protein coupled receptor member A-like n=1 Tax=Hydractinia symbiolongicarpus TaxID=13093 RepID=UPI00254FFC23|nr:mas-related G-protein coupled receptor member A-like [Hydractinia symbiolongicarpus]